MSKQLPFLLIGLFLLFGCQKSKDVTQFVNPFIGTDFNGHTFPGATVPFGMVQLSPDGHTSGWNWCSGYHYSDSSLMGFSHLHLSGTGIGDYGDVLLMPQVGEPKWVPGTPENPDSGYRSRFSHARETASPGYYSVWLDDYNVKVELTTSQRVGLHRYTFPKSDSAFVLIDLKHGINWDRVRDLYIKKVGERRFVGHRFSYGWAKDQRVFFAIEFSKPFETFVIAVNDSVKPELSEAQGTNVKALLHFKTRQNEPILVKVGISAVDEQGALKNLQTEMPDWDFERVRNQAQKTWNAALSRIEVKGATQSERTTFYTALYHTMIAPNLLSDVDGRYRGMDGKIHQSKNGEIYTVFSLWDTFRAEHPLMTILEPERTIDWINTMLDHYDKGGLLPVWELAASETNVMIGYHAVPVIVDAYLKGLTDFDVEKAFEAMKASAMQDKSDLNWYRELGYIPADKEHESVSKTLEYAYDDWCIAQMAKALGKEKDFHYFSERAQFYKNVFDAQTGFMRPKDQRGQWLEPFDPFAVTEHFTEANAWQYTFFVPQDVSGLIQLMGGKTPFIAKLDSLFETSSELRGRFQADISGLIGQYAHGNEPSHNFAYMYNYADAWSKTQQRLKQIYESWYKATPDGLAGNDDCGQMSAWYVFSAMGFYPVCPGSNEYALGLPIFEKVKLHLPNGKQFTIKARLNKAPKGFYNRAILNGEVLQKPFLNHQQLMQGGELVFE